MKQFHLTQIGQPFQKQGKYQNEQWIKCKCDCGNICEKLYTAFKNGRCKTCSYKCRCKQKTDYSNTVVPKEKQLVKIRDQFTDFIVLCEPYLKYRKRYSNQKKRYIIVHDQVVVCQCVCGKKRIISCYALLKEKAKSCGCKKTTYQKKLAIPVNNKKKCSCCHKIKSTEHFGKSSNTSTGIQSQCRFCKYISDFLHKNPECSITRDELVLFIQQHNKKCDICKKDENTHEIKLGLDHCHKTGKLRGLLCNNCNTGLGKYKDSTILLKKAIKYLEKNN